MSGIPANFLRKFKPPLSFSLPQPTPRELKAHPLPRQQGRRTAAGVPEELALRD